MGVSTQTLDAGWAALKRSIMYYRGKAVGTVAACDETVDPLNYDQCFTRDFAVSAIAFLLRGETEIVRHFLEITLELQSRERRMNYFKPGPGVMPASFKVVHDGNEEHLDSDFGEQAIAKVAPIDAVFWWLILLKLYTSASGDTAFAQQWNVQKGIRYILDLCLTNRFDLFPTLLVPDGSFMIDRRMGVYGYPLDIQVLFFGALRAARSLLRPSSENILYAKAVSERITNLTNYIRQYYWLDVDQLRQIYRYRYDEFGLTSDNHFNIYPDAIPPWLESWITDNGGYFVGNVGPGQMDFRWFAQGNLLSIVVGLADKPEAHEILNQVEGRWSDLVSAMPIKACYPALEGRDWEIITGCDPKNTPWSYHNGGSWPFMLLWLALAAMKLKRNALAERALQLADKRLEADQWPEYYDGRCGRLIGKDARLFQTWTIAGFLASRELLNDPEKLSWFDFDNIMVTAH
ncbi:MAG: glycoside hydrolase 100 family protein [Cyanobacteria bacterium P01_A01_bin.135]